MAEIKIMHGDCVATMKQLAADGVTVDSVVCDPPYHLTSIVKRFGADNAAPAQHGTDGAFARASRGFMGQQWDGGDIAFQVETWRAAWEILKPGGYLLAFSGTRTYHRMAVAIEDAGFEIRDQIGWLYGSGFPKSHDVSKGIDRAAGVVREVLGHTKNARPNRVGKNTKLSGLQTIGGEITAPATDAACDWQGWGTALKPAWEPVVVARKPLEGTVAANVLKHGTGAINIDGCRVGDEGGSKTIVGRNANETVHAFGNGLGARGGQIVRPEDLGRFPANIIHDGSDEVIAAFPNDGDISAARFFYSAKASAAERRGSKHPTVKPVALMAYLVRLVTRRGGTVLDPFAGSGTTGEAAYIEGVNAILCEQSAEYVADIQRRIDAVSGSGPHSASARPQRGNSAAKHEPLPLFKGVGE